MRVAFQLLGWLYITSCAMVCAGQAERLVPSIPSATLQGRVTVTETINRKVTENPVRNLSVYVLTLEASKPFQNLQQQCRKAMGAPKADPVQTYRLCEKNMALALDLVPRLPSTATGQTDREGSFLIENVPAGQRYHIIGIKTDHDGNSVVVAGTTARLRAGESVRVELSENDPWTGRGELK